MSSNGFTSRDEADARYMARALELARRGWGQVAPNPMVGALVVADGEVVGEGFHARFGEDHAEVVALRQAGERARGAALYVTLEPCAHDGKTPSCVRAIQEAGIAEVIVACRDPNPTAAGGLDELAAAGARVRLGPAGDEARRLNAPFLWSHLEALPFVAVKLALSLDGRIAARPGVRSAVTGELAWREVHRLRAGFSAVLVGQGTAVADDPLLTARAELPPRVPPVRIVLDPDLRLSRSSALISSTDGGPVWVLASETEGAGPDGSFGERRSGLESAGARVLETAGGEAPELLELEDALRRLRQEGIESILVEGGARLASALIREGLAQRLYLLIAPIFFGDEGLNAFSDVPVAPRGDWRLTHRKALGEDTMLVLDRGSALDRLARPANGEV